MNSQRSWMAPSDKVLSGHWGAPIVAAILVGAVFLLLWGQFGRWRDEREVEAVRSRIASDVAVHRNALASALANRFALLQGLRAFVEVKLARGERLEDQYADFAGRLFGVVAGTRNLAVAQGSVYRLVYPAAGNERVVGYDLLADERAEVVEDTRRAISRPGIAVSGPYELKQGGTGLVAREAVTAGGRFWGLVAIAMDLQPILDEARLLPSDGRMETAVRRAGAAPFFGAASVFAGNPVVERVELPDGLWEIAARPVGGWREPGRESRRLWLLSGVVLALIPMSFVFVFAYRQRVLQAARVDAERRVREGTAELRLAMVVVENSPVVLVRWKPGEGWPVEYISENIRQFGYTPADFLADGLLYDQIVVPEDLPRVARECDQALASGDRHFRQEYRIRTKDGRVRWMEDRTTVSAADDGSLAYEGIVLDVTERKLNEDARQELERRLGEMFDNIQLIAVMLDLQGRVTFCNRYLVELTGRTPEELIGSDWFETCVPAGARETARTSFKDAMTSGSFGGHYENVVITKRGEIREIAWDNTILRDLEGRVAGSASFGRDVTDQRQLEAQYRHAQKMEAIGQLAGGVAHDFNNLLQVITGYAALALGELAPDKPLYPELSEIRRAADRATALVRQLLAFSRRQKIQRHALDLNETIANLLKMLRRLIGEHIELDFTPGYDVMPVLADAGLLEQVLMNLCVNARDVMPDGGRISISTANITVGHEFVEQRGWGQEGQYLLLTVSDTGPGIPPGMHDRIFEPFFTTKEVGKGTGLGLATVYGIVKQHEGMIEVARDAGRGASFRIYLPVASSVEEKAGTVASSAGAPGGHETILLAEDEELVRSLAKRVLERAGYRVLVAKDGEEAIAMAEAHAREIDLALLDVVMPKASGRDVGEQLKTIRPDVPVVYCSGYSRQTLDETWMPDEGVELLLKPYEPKVLLQRVRARLGHRTEGA